MVSRFYECMDLESDRKIRWDEWSIIKPRKRNNEIIM
jgi:hypothetical protein